MLPVDMPEQFSGSGLEAAPERWWTVFEDRGLNRRVEAALRENFTLESAWQRLRAAEAVADRESAALFPELEGALDGELSGGDSGGGFGDNGGGSGQELGLGLTASYEVDLWGRIRTQAQAERLRAQAGFADYQTAALTLSAEVARVWYQLVEAQNQRALLERQIETNEKVLRLLRARFGSGQIRSADILRQEQLVEATREQRIIVESRIEVLEHQLAVLQGVAPQGARVDPVGDLPELPPLPRTGLPIELVQRRPDVRQAFLLVQAANRDLASAISNQYPRLTLTGGFRSESETPEDLFDNWLRNIAGNLLAPLIDGGRRAAEVERTRAVEKQRLAQYGQEVLTAFQEVEDALIQEQQQRRRIASLRGQVELAEQTVRQLQVEYLNGVSDYIDVLTALTEEQRLRRDLLTARRQLVEFRIALYRALAGGFSTERER